MSSSDPRISISDDHCDPEGRKGSRENPGAPYKEHEGLSRSYLYLARVLTIAGSIAYSIARVSPAPLPLLILLIIATRIAIKRIGARDMEQIIEIPVHSRSSHM